MATYTTSDFKPGLKFMQDGEPCVIVENEFVKPGKGQAFTRTRIRKLISGKVLDVNFKSGTSVEAHKKTAPCELEGMSNFWGAVQ